CPPFFPFSGRKFALASPQQHDGNFHRTGRGRSLRRPSQLSEPAPPEAWRARHPRGDLPLFLLPHRQHRRRGGRVAALVSPALGGTAHPHPAAPSPVGKSPRTTVSAGRVPLSRPHRTDR